MGIFNLFGFVFIQVSSKTINHFNIYHFNILLILSTKVFITEQTTYTLIKIDKVLSIYFKFIQNLKFINIVFYS